MKMVFNLVIQTYHTAKKCSLSNLDVQNFSEGVPWTPLSMGDILYPLEREPSQTMTAGGP